MSEIFLLAGEASGDQRGAELIRALRARDPSFHFGGMGGPAMRAEGMEILADVSPLAVVGIVEVIRNYRFFRRTMDRLLEEIGRRKPLAVVGVDYPGFNLRLLREARARFGRSIRLLQYVSPQRWAWNEWRKWGMAKYLDAVLCIFPFEPVIYQEAGLKAVFVGHPLAGTAAAPEERRDLDLVGWFPGSREREIRAHLPVFAESERLLKAAKPSLQFAWAASSERAAAAIRSFVPKAVLRPAADLYVSAGAGAVCSGTATLESALHGLPICVVYRVAWPTYWMGRALIRVPHLAMPNLLAEKPLLREFIQADLTPRHLCAEILRLTGDAGARRTFREGYAEIREKLGKGRAAERAAAEIAGML